jgi:hypothetical protein
MDFVLQSLERVHVNNRQYIADRKISRQHAGENSCLMQMTFFVKELDVTRITTQHMCIHCH